MLIRAAKIEGVDFSTFQEDFDLGRDDNHFGAVAKEIKQRYPHIHFRDKSFESGLDKVRFIREMLKNKKPVLVSRAHKQNPGNWHIMPVVDATDTSFCFLVFKHKDGKTDEK